MTLATPMPSYHYLRGKRFEAYYKRMVKTCFWCLEPGEKCKNYILGNGNACKASGTQKASFKHYISNLWTNIGWDEKKYDENNDSSQPAIQPATNFPANDQDDLANMGRDWVEKKYDEKDDSSPPATQPATNSTIE